VVVSFYGIDVKKSVTKLTEEEGEGDRGKGGIKGGKRGKGREGGEGGVRGGGEGGEEGEGDKNCTSDFLKNGNGVPRKGK
jgi:hypothetical protein